MLSPRFLRVLLSASVLAALALPVRAGDKEWKEPSDGVLTEKQVEGTLLYSSRLRKRFERLNRENKARGGKEMSASEALAKVKQFSDGNEQDVKDSGLDPKELDWANGVVSETFLAVYSEKISREIWDKVVKDADAKVIEAEKKKAAVAEAKKSGRRPMTPEEKETAKKDAQEDVKTAEAAVKDAETALKDARTAQAEREADLRKASDDEKEGAQQALDAAKDTVKEKETVLADAKKEVVRTKKKASDPDLPQNDDEKAALVKECDEREKEAQDELDAAKKDREQVGSMKKDQEAENAKLLAKYPAKNVDLVRAKKDRIEQESLFGLWLPKTEPKK